MEDSPNAKGDQFEKVVETLLRQAGYEVQRGGEIVGRQTDLTVASQITYPVVANYLIECKYRENPRAKLSMDIVNDVENRIKAARRHGIVFQSGQAVHDPDIKGWLISNADIASRAHTYANSLGIIFTHYGQLVTQLLSQASPGFDRYSRELVYDFDQYRASYINPIGTPVRESGQREDSRESLDEFIWAQITSTAAESKPILLVGDIGVGKTLYVKKLAATLAESFQKGSGHMIPLLIPFDQMPSDLAHQSCRDQVWGYLEEMDIVQNTHNTIGDASRITIVDEFNSSSAIQGRPIRIRRCLHSLARLSSATSTVIVTCRSAFYNTYLEQPSISDLFDVIVLRPFTEDMIRAYLERYDVDPDESWQMLVDYHLKDLARIPVILALITHQIENLPYLAKPGYTRARVILEIVRSEIRNVPLYIGQKDNAQNVLEAIAYKSWQNETFLVSFDDLRGASPLSKSTSSIAQDAIDILHHADTLDILECVEQDTIILRRIGDSIAFAHPVFRDILAAGYLFKRLKALGHTDLSTDVGSFVVELLLNSSAQCHSIVSTGL